MDEDEKIFYSRSRRDFPAGGLRNSMGDAQIRTAAEFHCTGDGSSTETSNAASREIIRYQQRLASNYHLDRHSNDLEIILNRADLNEYHCSNIGGSWIIYY